MIEISLLLFDLDQSSVLLVKCGKRAGRPKTYESMIIYDNAWLSMIIYEYWSSLAWTQFESPFQNYVLGCQIIIPSKQLESFSESLATCFFSTPHVHSDFKWRVQYWGKLKWYFQKVHNYNKLTP